jgi:hypothetical protein
LGVQLVILTAERGSGSDIIKVFEAKGFDLCSTSSLISDLTVAVVSVADDGCNLAGDDSFLGVDSTADVAASLGDLLSGDWS